MEFGVCHLLSGKDSDCIMCSCLHHQKEDVGLKSLIVLYNFSIYKALQYHFYVFV